MLTREFREELGVALSLEGVRPSVTVQFDGGFDDFFLAERDLALEELTLQTEEVSDARWAELPEVLEMVEQGTFLPYPKSFLMLLFDLHGKKNFFMM